jgi:hypothetical protein
LVATAVHVYVLVLVSDPTVIGDVAPEADWVAPPSLDAHVTVKPVIASLPSPFAVKATIVEFCPRVTPLMVGASGTVAATNELDATESAPAPIALPATTMQEYVLPLLRELTVIGEAVSEFVWVAPPSLDAQVTV